MTFPFWKSTSRKKILNAGWRARRTRETAKRRNGILVSWNFESVSTPSRDAYRGVYQNWNATPLSGTSYPLEVGTEDDTFYSSSSRRSPVKLGHREKWFEVEQALKVNPRQLRGLARWYEFFVRWHFKISKRLRHFCSLGRETYFAIRDEYL